MRPKAPNSQNIYEFDLKANHSMSLNVTFNGHWENRITITDITSGTEICQLRGQFGEEYTQKYDNLQEDQIRIQCMFEHRKRGKELWEPDAIKIKAATAAFKKIMCEDGFDTNFTDIVMFICINQTEKPPMPTEQTCNLANCIKMTVKLKEPNSLNVSDFARFTVTLKYIGEGELEIQGLKLAGGYYTETNNSSAIPTWIPAREGAAPLNNPAEGLYCDNPVYSNSIRLNTGQRWQLPPRNWRNYL